MSRNDAKPQMRQCAPEILTHLRSVHSRVHCVPTPEVRYDDRGTDAIVSSIRACSAALDATIWPRVSSTGAPV